MTRTPPAKTIASIAATVLLFLIIVIYGLGRGRDILFGIRLSVRGIESGQSVSDPLLTFSGTARHAASIAVDGQIIPVDLSGNWSDAIALLPGYNHIVVTAFDRFGKSVSKEFVVYNTSPAEIASPSTPETATATPVDAPASKNPSPLHTSKVQ